jgi:hypothetical protein
MGVAAMMNRPTYTSFIPIRDWTNSIPSDHERRDQARDQRRRNRIRVRRYRHAAISARR